MTSDKRYFYSLDAIRGVAAILVAMRHNSEFFGFSFQESYLAVDVFFVLSGIVIANAYEQRLANGLSAGQFLWLRIARLYPLYILGTVITLAACALGYIDLSLRVVVVALLMLPNPRQWEQYYPLNPPSWSLFFELLANALYGRYVRWVTRWRLMAVMGIAGVWLAHRVLQEKHMDIGYVGHDIAGLFRVAYSFSAGLLLYRLFIANKPMVRYNTWAFLAIPTVIAVILTQSPSPVLRPYYDLAIVFVGFPAMVYVALLIEPSGLVAQACRFLGTTSYALYALHMPAGILLKGFLTTAGIKVYPPWLGFSFIAGLMLLCWLLDTLYDIPVRTVMIKWLPRKASVRPVTKAA